MQRQLTFGGSTFKVMTIDKPHQPTYDEVDRINDIGLLLQPPPAQDSPKHILSLLNNHCLCKIFEEFDHLADFDSIARVCIRFNEVAKLVFPPKIRSRWINFDDFVFDDGHLHDSITSAQIENFLYNFGSSIESLSIRPFYFEKIPNTMNLVLKMIHKHCRNICNLNIEISNEQNEISNEIRLIFSKLKILHVKFHTPLPDHDFLSACTEIEELKVHSNRNQFQMPEISFPKLRKFETIFALTNSRFLELNLQIEELHIHRDNFDRRSRERVLQFVTRNMLNLKNATLNVRIFDDIDFLSNPTLNVKVFCDDRINQIFHLQNITQIDITVFESFESRLIDVAKNLPNLEKIEIHCNSSVSIATIKQVLQHANKVSEFNLCGCIVGQFDKNVYNEILPLILAREKCIKLTITLQYICSTYMRKDWHKKMEFLNEHPNLTAFIYYTQICR